MTRPAPKALLLVACAAALLNGACPTGSPPEAPSPGVATTSGAGPGSGSAWAPSEGCPPVPVPDGDFELLGDPRACKGGRIVLETNSYPTHFSYYGPERDFNLQVEYCEAFLNTLVTVHQNTLEIVPELATLEETERGRVFIFHIDPDARWSDGNPIVAEDVIKTWDVIMEPAVTEVVYKQELERFEKPVKVDDKTVRWEAKEASWRNILLLADVYIYPAHLTDPKTFLTDWRWKPLAYSGMYELGAHETGKFIELVRRKDFWGAGKRQFIGLGNFDSIYRKIIDNDDTAWEHMKKGDIDYHLVTRAQRWVEDMNFDKIQKGWIQKQRMWMREPQVPARMAFNLEHPIFKDPKVRRGLFWLYDREYLHDQIFYGEYLSKNSYFANSIYENKDNEKITFNPEKGLALLAEAGWTQRDKDGTLMKDGRRLEFDFIYIHPSAERAFTPIQETFRKYGVKMNMKIVQPTAWSKLMDAKEFELVYANWGPSSFPDPRHLWHSERAKQNNTSNVTRFADPRVDALIEQYEAEFDLEKRAELVRQIDGLLYEQTPYLLDWYSASWRNTWWDKFGMPEWCTWATLDIRFSIWQTWWYDEARAKRLEEAIASGKSVPQAPPENTTWKL